MDVIDKAEDLAVTAIAKVTNESKFPKRYRWCLNDPIMKMAIQINTLVHSANSIYPTNKREMELRNQYQLKAIAEINGLMSMISVAKKSFKLDLNSVANWLKDLVDERALLKRWYEGDKDKYDGMSE